MNTLEQKVIDWDEDEWDMTDKWFLDALSDAVGTELFSEHNPITHVRIGNRAWEITIPDIKEDSTSQWLKLIEIDSQTIKHLE